MKKDSTHIHMAKKQKLAVEWNRRLSSTEYTQRRMPFGKYTNWMIKDLPTDYIKWGILNIKGDIASFFARELQRRQPQWK